MNYKQPAWLGKRYDWKLVTDEQLAAMKQELTEYTRQNQSAYALACNKHKDFTNDAIAFYGRPTSVVKAMVKYCVPKPPDLLAEYSKIVRKVDNARAAAMREAEEQNEREWRSEIGRKAAKTRKENKLQREHDEYVEHTFLSD